MHVETNVIKQNDGLTSIVSCLHRTMLFKGGISCTQSIIGVIVNVSLLKNAMPVL